MPFTPGHLFGIFKAIKDGLESNENPPPGSDHCCDWKYIGSKKDLEGTYNVFQCKKCKVFNYEPRFGDTQ